MYFQRGYHQLKYSQYFIQDLPSSKTMTDWKSHLRLEIFQLLEYLEDHPRTCKWLISMVIVSPLSRVVGSDVGFRRVRNVLKTPLFTWFCAATCILYWCPQYFVNVAFFTAICSVFRRCSKKNAKPSHASAHFAKCVLQKNEMDCLGTYFPHAQT